MFHYYILFTYSTDACMCYHTFRCLQAFGVSVEELERYVNNGIHQWGDPVSYVQMEGALSVTQTKASHDTPLVSMLMAGEL